MSRRTQGPSRFLLRFRLRGFHPLRHIFPDILTTFLFSFVDGPITPASAGLGSFPFARHYSENRFYFLFLQVLRCFSSLSLSSICARSGYTPFLVYGFPHSDIAGSLSAYDSPTRFAVCCVLLRLDVPRHPPNALSSLTLLSFRFAFLVYFLFRLLKKISLLFSSLYRFTDIQFSMFSQVSSRTPETKTYLPVFLLFLPRKEVIHPHVPVGIPCYDFTPIIKPTFDSSFLSVRPPASGVFDSHGVTGGVYKARERIHRSMADLRLLAIPASCTRVADCNPDYDSFFEFCSASRLRFPLFLPL